MSTPSFASLRIALEDSDARVRIEAEIPASVPYVEALRIEGGFLDGVEIHFSNNLNCLIGGRGTGKSTTFESIRCLTGQPSSSPLVDSEAWPSTLTIFWRDQAGQSHKLSRQSMGAVTNCDDPNGPWFFQIESYGQGETAHISKAVDENPLALLDYLDRFIDLREPIAEEATARDELLEIQTSIEKAQKEVNKITQYERDLEVVSKQLKALEKEKAKEIIGLQRKLALGAEVRSSIVLKLREIKGALDSQAVRSTIDELVNLAEPNNLAVGSLPYSRISEKAVAFRDTAGIHQAASLAEYETLRKHVETQIGEWKTAEFKSLAEIALKKEALEAKGIRLDMAYIEKLSHDEAKYTTDIKTLKTWIPHLSDQKKSYSACRKKRWAARSRVATIRQSYGKMISDLLKTTLTDLTVNLKFTTSCHSPDTQKQIVAAMGWRTSQIPRAQMLVESLTVPKLLEAIDQKDSAAIVGIKTPEGTTVFDERSAKDIIERLSQPDTRFALERTEVYDLPRLTVTKSVTDPDGKTRHLVRGFSKLSLGQQQSTLLALMLASSSNSPLIIDQPEDNLDGEFIYQSLVPILRRAKERRQIIIVTHNANIAVLGDAEQIIVLKSTSDKGLIASRGSIDASETRSHACGILEGAEEAFARRARIYGVT